MKKCVVAKPGIYSGDDAYITKSKGDAITHIKDVLQSDPDTEVVMYGGDGSVYEAVNAIMDSGASDTCKLTVVARGTGNDFVKSFDDNDYHSIDLIKVNDKYCANMVNIGFDCDAVIATEKINSKKFTGSFSYVIGVVATFFKKFPRRFDIEMTLDNGTTEEIHGNCLLCLAANGMYCGGGFKAAPAAKLDDQLFDVFIFRKVSRLALLRLIGTYKKGTHIDSEGNLIKSFQKYAIYRKCSSMTVSGPKNICIDGEVLPLEKANISIVPSAINVRVGQ